MLKEINVPKLNASDENIKVIDVNVNSGSEIKIGDILFTYETSKASFEFISENNGFIYHRLTAESFHDVGAIVAYVNDKKIPINDEDSLFSSTEELSNVEKVLTKKAQKLVRENNIDVDSFKEDLITEDLVKSYLKRHKNTNKPVNKKFTPNDIVIMGVGGHAGMCIDILNASKKYSLAGFIDKNMDEDMKYGLDYLGNIDGINDLIESGLENLILGIGFIGNLPKRDDYYDQLSKVIEIPTIIHESAIVEESAKIGNGCQIMAGAIIGSNVSIGENCIINSGCIISHDSVIGKSSHITPGAVLAGNVIVGERCMIGMCSTIYIGVSIPNDSTIKNNETILA